MEPYQPQVSPPQDQPQVSPPKVESEALCVPSLVNPRKRKTQGDIGFIVCHLLEELKNLEPQAYESSNTLLGHREVLESIDAKLKSARAKFKKAKVESLPEVLEEAETLLKSINEIDSETLKQNILEKQTEYSQLLKICREGGLLNRHVHPVKRLFSTFIGLGEKGKIEPQHMKRIAKVARLLEDPSQFVTFIVEDKTIRIQKTCLLNGQSPYFRALLSGSYEESTDKPIKIEEISYAHFKVLKAWIENPTLGNHFDKMEVGEIFDFIEAAHRFEIPKLITDCERSFDEKLNAKSLAELVPLFNRVTSLKELEIYRNLSFNIIEEALVANLQGLGLEFCCSGPLFHQAVHLILL